MQSYSRKATHLLVTDRPSRQRGRVSGFGEEIGPAADERRFHHHLVLVLKIGLIGCGLSGAARAQTAQPAQPAQPAQTPVLDLPGTAASETVIVTGTRVSGTKARNSLSPIDVISGKELVSTGQSNIRDALMQILPSISHQTQGTTVGALTDSINLRGLSPNETLVLVNGKRWHPTTNIQTDAGPFRGSTPVDIDLIPVSMVDHVEVLRDGASAQYGSDAVAGVVNIILKTSDRGGALSDEVGVYGEGDGFTDNLDLDRGFKFGPDAYLHAGLSYRHANPTDQTGTDAQTRHDDAHWIGDPRSDRIAVALDAGDQITPGIELYDTTNYAHRDADTFQIYRLPSVLPALYPAGFSPILGIDENSYGDTLGLRGGDLAGWIWDLSSTYGGDNASYNMRDSANTTYYKQFGQTDTRFLLDTGASTQLTNNFDVKRAFQTDYWRFPINVATGLEDRWETYSLGHGSYESYILGGSQAVPGVMPQSAGTWERDVYGLYLDTATKLTDKWKIDVAGRLEHYTDSGDAESGKLASRYDFNRFLGVRGTISNSVRAPTLAEEHHTAATVTTSGATGELAPDSAGARLLGATPLSPERSTNITAGFTLHPMSRLDIEADAYQIDIRDRILDGGTYSGLAAIDAFAAEGRTLPVGTSASAVSASYLTNAASTRTQGVDLTANYKPQVKAGHLTLDASFNFNQTGILAIGTNVTGRRLLNLQQLHYLTTDAPHNALIVGGHWDFPRWIVSLHELRYGHIFDELTIQQGTNAFSTSVFQPYTLRPRYITDLSVSYKVTPRLIGTVGADNLFDEFPNKIPYPASYYGEAKYDRYAEQISFDGGFYYLRLSQSF